MAYVALADRGDPHALHDPTTFIEKYVWSQDHKVIAVQYGITAIAIGLVALVMSVMMRLQRGQGTFAKLTTDSALYVETTAAVTELRAL